MRKVLLIAFVLWGALAFSANSISYAKKDTTHKIRIISLSAGFIKTSLNFFKNAAEETYSNGYGFRALFQPGETFRVGACYSKVESVNIDPTWVNVNNSFYDLDAHFMMHFLDKRNIAYFILGLSAQHWKGFYTGLHDLNSWKLNIPKNSMYQSLYFGGRIGMGAEIKIIGPISGYGEFIFRITKTDVGSGISDVVYGLGIKVNVANLGNNRSSKRRHSILKFGDKYHWF